MKIVAGMWSTLPPRNQRTAMCSLRSTTWIVAPPKNGAADARLRSAALPQAGRKPMHNLTLSPGVNA